MSEFLGSWLQRLREALSGFLEDDDVERVLSGEPDPEDPPDDRELAEWTADMVRRLEQALTPGQVHEVMTSCACRYSRERIARLRDIYRRTGSVGAVIDEMWRLHRQGLRDGMMLDDEVVQRLAELGWGVGGRLQGNTITVTKIPRTANLRRYMSEDDSEARRRLYCHCPRVHAAPAEGVRLPKSHCLCGAGYYRYLWQRVLGCDVTTEVVESVCSGGDVCTFRIHLPMEVL